jgi:HlyD family secretion protein
MKKSISLFLLASVSLFACRSGNNNYDASGTFEADEVIVSAEVGGRITYFGAEEGKSLQKDSVVAQIDATNVELQKEQAEASVEALAQKTLDVNPQVQLLKDQLEVQRAQLNNLSKEQQRVQRLLKEDAATAKQLDDINFQLESVQKSMRVTEQQIKVQVNTVSTQNRGILSEAKPLAKKVAQLSDQLSKSAVVNPITGVVLTKYAEAGELAAPGKALYKIADISNLNLRAYITGDQLSTVKLGQQVKVLVDDGADKYKELAGVITWISDKAEFTPKTIQTKEERAHLVYAMKVNVKNDGFLKIGMYGEVKF